MSNVIFRRRGDTWALLCLSGMDLEPLMDYPPSKEKELVCREIDLDVRARSPLRTDR